MPNQVDGIPDYSVDAADGTITVDDRTHITSPDFRDLFYERGYISGYSDPSAVWDDIAHPSNRAAWEQGYADGKGDRDFSLTSNWTHAKE